MLAAVIAYAAVLPRRNAPCIVGYLRIRILIDKIQTRFSTVTARSGNTMLRSGRQSAARTPRIKATARALCDSVAACKIYSAALRASVYEQPEIFLVLRSESQYFEGTSLSKISDNEHPSAGLSDSEIFAVKHAPAYAIPQFAKRVNDLCETVSFLRTKQTGNIFKDKIPRSLGFKDSCELKKESTPRISER